MKNAAGILVDIVLTGKSARNDVIAILEKYAANTILVHTLHNPNNSEHIMFYYQDETSNAIKELTKLSDNPRRSCQYTQIPLVRKARRFVLRGRIAADRSVMDQLPQNTILRIIPQIVELLSSVADGGLFKS